MGDGEGQVITDGVSNGCAPEFSVKMGWKKLRK